LFEASSAVTVTLNGVPAVADAGAVTAKCVAGAEPCTVKVTGAEVLAVKFVSPA
jgi:hypothetical protein